MAIQINKYLRLKQSPQSTFSILYFLTIFCSLAGFFYVFVGITSPGGKTYSSFLDHYLNITNWLTWLIAKASLFVLKLCGFTVYQRALNNVTIAGGRGVTILWACLGLGVMSFWTAFVAAHRAAWQFKIKWCFTGIALITILNIIRIMLIAVANYYHWRLVTSLDPHQTFNIASYLLLFALIAWFIQRYKAYRNNQTVLTGLKQKTATIVAANTHSSLL